MPFCDQNFRFWAGFLFFLAINFITSGFQTLRDGILVDYFAAERHISGFLYGLGQAFYGIGQGITLVGSLTCVNLRMERSMKQQFLISSFLVAVLSLFIGLGEFISNRELFITLDYIWRFLLGVVSFKNQLLITEMVDLWFKRNRDLFLGVVLTVRYAGSAIFQYTGALVYVKYGYFVTFLVHGATMLPVIVPALCLVVDPEILSSEISSLKTDSEREEKNKVKPKEQDASTDKPTSALIERNDGGRNLHKLSYFLLISLLTNVAPCGLYSVLITPYFQNCCNMSVDGASIYLTVMTATSAVSFTVVGYLLHHVSCFATLLVGGVLLIMSPLLLFHTSSQVLSVVGVVMYGVGGPLGTLSLIPCMEITHCLADKSNNLSVKVQTQIKSLWWGVWAVGGYSSSILAGVALDYLTYEQIAITVCLVEVVGFSSAVTVLVCHYCIS